MKIPSPLRKGDLIGVIAPASPFDIEKYKEGKRVLKEEGFRIKEGKNIFKKNGYLAGNVQERLSDLQEMINDPNVRAFMAIRGGYGTMQLLPHLQENMFISSPKLFIGSSDLTALHLYLNFRVGIVTIYGPMVNGSFGVASDETTLRNFKEIAELPDEYEYPIGDVLIANQGVGEGILVGGCLSIITSLLGTPFEPDFDDKIVFLEDINEPLYKWDRMLTQLILAGKLRNVKGLIITIADVIPYEANSFVGSFFRGWKIPIITNFLSGHTVPSFSLPFGYMAKIDTFNRQFKVWKIS